MKYLMSKKIFEQYGSNKIVENITEVIFDIINQNFGKLFLNRHIELNKQLANNQKTGDIKFIDDTIIVRLSNRDYANMNPDNIVIEDNCISNLVMNIELVLSEKEFIAKRIFKDNSVYSTISHELLHVLETYFSSKKKKSKSWENGRGLSKMKYNSKIWDKISYFIYLSLPHEIRARVQELSIKTITNKPQDVLEYIKNSKIYKDALFLSKIDPKLIINDLKNDPNYLRIISDFNRLFLENEITDIALQENELFKHIKRMKKINTDMLTKLIKITYYFEDFDRNQDINYDEYI